jgi:hypothetical protein
MSGGGRASGHGAGRAAAGRMSAAKAPKRGMTGQGMRSD